jgi:hypothetical protein
MGLEINGVMYADARECFADVKRMVRAGVAKSVQPLDIEATVPQALSRLKDYASQSGNSFTESGELSMMRLEAEWLAERGKTESAVAILEPVWTRLNGPLSKWKLPERPLEPGRDRVLLRQRVWTLMYYVFFRFFKIEGDVKTAVDHMKRLRNVIWKELSPLGHSIDHGDEEEDSRSPLATWAMWHYLYGHCCRAQRHFPTAEKHFLDAQAYSQRRIEKKLSHRDRDPEFDREYEIAYNNVFSARILGSGLSWVAVHAGHLTRAIQFLRTSLALLTGTQQEPLKVTLRGLLAIASRRHAPLGKKEYADAMRELALCHKQFGEFGDVPGQRRCSLEIVRGNLDLAELRKDDKQLYLERAATWIDRLGPADNARDQTRYHLIRSRYSLLAGDQTTAQTEWAGAKKLAVTELNVSVAITEGLVLIASGEAAKALRVVERELDYLRPGRIHASANRNLEIVQEAQCYLLLVLAAKTCGQFKKALFYMKCWGRLSTLVENAYLREFARPLSKELQFEDFQLEFEFEMDRTIPSRIAEFTEFLETSVRVRFPEVGRRQLADWFEVDESTITRWNNEQWSKPVEHRLYQRDMHMPPKTKRRAAGLRQRTGAEPAGGL